MLAARHGCKNIITEEREESTKNGGGSMVEKGVRTDFMSISSNITKKNRDGSVQVFIQVQGMPITDRELAELRKLQEELATKVDGALEE